MSVFGTVSKSPEEDRILAALSPFLLEVFRAHPNGRAVLWMESYEAEGGAAVTEIFATDEELRPVGTEHRLETRRHFLDFGIQGEWEAGGKASPTPNRAENATSLCLMFNCDDEGPLAELAGRAAAQVKRSRVGSASTRAFVLQYLEEMASRTDKTVGPKGGLSVWGRTGALFDVVDFVKVANPFFRELTADLGGVVLLYQTADEKAGACRLGHVEPENGGKTRCVAGYHDLPFGLSWAPALLER